MTRKKAIEIVVETAKKCSWIPDKWEEASVMEVTKKWGSGYSVGFATKTNSPVLIINGVQKREGQNGYSFTRGWLEKKGYL